MEYCDVRYLTSKRTVDDRALNGHVAAVVRDRFCARTGEVRVLELGGGPGTMVDRMLRWGMLRCADYTIVDMNEEFLRVARQSPHTWESGVAGRPVRSTHNRALPEARVRVRTACTSLESWLDETPAGETFDLVVANAVLDLVDVPKVLPQILQRLRPDGLFWLTINFDGETILMPPVEHDEEVLNAFHASMGATRREGRPLGDAYTGRHLFGQLAAAGARIEAAGSSDWVVFAQDGSYEADEAYFLHHIVRTIELELRTHPNVGPHLEQWAAERHAQVDAGRLVYIAHQLDFVGSAVGRS